MELERKFLTSSSLEIGEWRSTVITQIYPVVGRLYSSRIRFKDTSLILTIKSREASVSREELEVSIDLTKEQLDDLRDGIDAATPAVLKTRYFPDLHEYEEVGEWSIDVFTGHLSGLIIAEFELHGDVVENLGEAMALNLINSISLPNFCGTEVTLDRRYRNEQLAMSIPFNG
jgi:CYTH domain-containing protein